MDSYASVRNTVSASHTGQPIPSDDVLVTRLEVCLPSHVSRYGRQVLDVDEIYFPSQLSINLNVLQESGVSQAAESGSRSSVHQNLAQNPAGQVDPPDSALLAFFSSFPARAISGLRLLTLLQQRFSARVKLVTAFRDAVSPKQFVFVCGVLALAFGSGYSTRGTQDMVWAIPLAIIGLIGIIIALNTSTKKSLIDELISPGPIRVCGNCNEVQVSRVEGEQRAWHAQVNFKARNGHALAEFEIRWRICDEQCRCPLPQLQEVVVNPPQRVANVGPSVAFDMESH